MLLPLRDVYMYVYIYIYACMCEGCPCISGLSETETFGRSGVDLCCRSQYFCWLIQANEERDKAVNMKIVMACVVKPPDNYEAHNL